MKKGIFLAAGLSILLFSALIGPAAKAQDVQDTVNKLNETAGRVSAFNAQVAANNDNRDFLSTRAGVYIGLVLSFVGVLFLGLMIYAGILWMTAAGNDQQITQAKNLLVNATIGIIIVFAAYAITVFLGNRFAQ